MTAQAPDATALRTEASVLADRVRSHKAAARYHRRSAADAARALAELRARAADYGIRLVTASEAKTDDRTRRSTG
jgi:hypothetical protein